jgi:hypothetical protein
MTTEKSTYAEMVIHAIEAEKNPKGSSLCYIKKYLECNYKIPPTSHHITKTLTKLSTQGILIASLDKNGNPYHKYKIASEKKVKRPAEPGLEMRGQKWTKEEDELLIKECGDKMTFTDIAAIHKRTEIAIILRGTYLSCIEL